MTANKLSALTNHSESSNPLYRRPERPYTHYYYYTYDLAGNLTQRVVNGKANCYTYNAQNKLKRILGDGFTNEFVYDSGNRRIALSNKIWRYFIHDGAVPIAEVDSNSNVTRWFVRGVGIADGTGDMIAEVVPTGTIETVHFYLSNHRGDTLMTLTNSGNIETTLRYDAFGKKYQQSGTFTPRYTFSTKEYLSDAILYLYAYRVYDPIAGRWTQRDPIDYQDSENLYQFCGNNPVNGVEEYGLVGTSVHTADKEAMQTLDDLLVTANLNTDESWTDFISEANYKDGVVPLRELMKIMVKDFMFAACGGFNYLKNKALDLFIDNAPVTDEQKVSAKGALEAKKAIDSGTPIKTGAGNQVKNAAKGFYSVTVDAAIDKMVEPANKNEGEQQ